MAKKTPESEKILSIEDNFLKVMEGGDDFSSFFDDALVGEPTTDAQMPAPSGKDKSEAAPQTSPDKKPAGREALKESGLELTVAKDCMVAHLIGTKSHSFTSDSITKALEDEGIIRGINFDSIVQMTSTLEQEGAWTGKIVIARGALPTEKEKMSFPFITKGDWNDPEEGWVVDGNKLPFTALVELFGRDDLPEEEEVSRVIVRPVQPGETLAVVEAKQDPAPGFDIYGRTIPVGKPILVPGKKVKRNDTTGNYEAMTFGYLCITGNVISIIPPIIISPDNMEAYFVNCPHRGAGKEPSVNSIKYALIMKGVDEKRISQSRIEKLCAGLKQDKIATPLIKIASGIEPMQGRDAKIILNVDMEEKAGTLQENDSIDLKERNVIHSVAQGDLIATKYFASTGRPGVTLFNKKLKQKSGTDLDLAVQGPVVRKRYTDKVEYYAKVAGNISFTNDTLTLTDIYRVNGNVDYATGNINVTTGLIVTESIMPGFKVSAGGDTLIGGTVENGAHVLVRGNLNVGKGIIGKDTKIVVLGSLQAEFVQDAEIMVKGDVEIRSYSFNGTIRSGGEIVIKKSAAQRGGKVIGGIVCATKGITISTFGGPANKNTLAAIQKDVESLSVLKKTQETIQNSTGTIMKIMKSLKLEAVDMGLIRRLIESTPADKRGMLVKIIGNLNNLIITRKELLDREKTIEKQIALTLKKAKIRINNDAYLGNKIRFDDQQIILNRDLGPTVFELQDEKIIY